MSDVDSIGTFLEVASGALSGLPGGPTMAQGGSGRDGELDFKLRVLEDEMGALKLINAALLELLLEKNAFALAEIKSKALEIDARDGKIDGRIPRAVAKCHKCGKTLLRGKSRCAYCGTEV